MSDKVIEAARAVEPAVSVVDCDPHFADTAEFCQHYGYKLGQSANAIIVVGKSEPRTYACCVALATTRINVNSTVRRMLGARKASFASAQETQRLTAMEIGGVTPFGLPSDLPVWIDDAVIEADQIIVGGGSRDRKLLLSADALARLPGALVVEGLATPIPSHNGEER